jgi:hypothetical protein
MKEIFDGRFLNIFKGEKLYIKNGTMLITYASFCITSFEEGQNRSNKEPEAKALSANEEV